MSSHTAETRAAWQQVRWKENEFGVVDAEEGAGCTSEYGMWLLDLWDTFRLLCLLAASWLERGGEEGALLQRPAARLRRCTEPCTATPRHHTTPPIAQQ